MAETETGEADRAFEAIYRDHSQAVYGLVGRICGPALAGRVAQDVFAGLRAHPERFDPARSSLRSFLLDHANSQAIDAVRTATSRACREQTSTQHASRSRGDGGRELIGQERSARMAWAIGTLPAPERDAVVSAFYSDVAYREAARMLAVSDEDFRARVRAGLMKLRLAVDAAPSEGARRRARGSGPARAGSPDPPRRRGRARPPPTPGHRLPE